MYILMNKDKEVMRFALIDGALGHSYQIISQDETMLPYGFDSIEDWIGSRKGSKHNAHLKEIMKSCGCEDDIGYIKITHAATLNDTYWVKEEKENATWNDISLYRNEFNEQISKLAFEGVGLYGIQMSSTSPELSTGGSFRKCWKREESGIYLYKRGSSKNIGSGMEPYCEMMASEFARQVCKDAIKYDKVMLHGELASKCRLFTDENHGYVSYANLGKGYSANEMLKFYESIGSEDEFRRMLILDAISFNVDRHAGNHGVLVNNDTKEIISIAPIFDLNMSLLPYIIESEFNTIGDKMLQYGPRIGDDFTRIGQLSMTSEIRKTLISLKGFEFSFKGDDKFTPKRVKLMEDMVNRQIEAVLSKDILYTKDVFVPSMKQKQTEPIIDDSWLEKQGEVAQCVAAVLDDRINGISYYEEADTDARIVYLNVNLTDRIELKISMDDLSTELFVDWNPINPSEYLQKDTSVANIYTKISKILDAIDSNGELEKTPCVEKSSEVNYEEDPADKF